MKRLDKLVLKSFFSPFILTTVVATFILLIQYMLKYFDDFVGKDLGFEVFGKLLFYFSLNMLQVALPLGVLVSSLMTFGNLGENFELTAIKGAGISLVRALKPIFFFVVLLSIAAFYFNDQIVPSANLKAYSLLYDIKHKKPALDIKKGVFYDGIPNYSIKAGYKFSDNKTLKNVMIYDHSQGRDGNRRVILADSSRMYTIYDDKYLKLELYNGVFYNEAESKNEIDQFYRTGFDRLDMVFSLSSFNLTRTKEELFQNNRQMKNILELTQDIDSLSREEQRVKRGLITSSSEYLKFHFNPLISTIKSTVPKSDTIVKDSIMMQASIIPYSIFSGVIDLIQIQVIDSAILRSLPKRAVPGPTITNSIKTVQNGDSIYLYDLTLADLDSSFVKSRSKSLVTSAALSNARNYKVNISGAKVRINNITFESDRYTVEKYKKYSQSFACIVMFLIGAPLGAIIKKGGLGVPVIVSIFFFIIYYVMTITSEKWAKAGMIDGALAVWIADMVLLPIGLFFLRQARVDARLFDTDFYLVVIDQFKRRVSSSNNS